MSPSDDALHPSHQVVIGCGDCMAAMRDEHLIIISGQFKHNVRKAYKMDLICLSNESLKHLQPIFSCSIWRNTYTAMIQTFSFSHVYHAVRHDWHVTILTSRQTSRPLAMATASVHTHDINNITLFAVCRFGQLPVLYYCQTILYCSPAHRPLVSCYENNGYVRVAHGCLSGRELFEFLRLSKCCY